MSELEPSGERLQKVLAASGYGSRRVCEDLIADGRVAVNGEVARLGRRVDADNDAIFVDGAPVASKAGLVHYLLNKPTGVVTTADDPEGRAIVTDLVPAEPRVFPVGRLDFDSEGLLLMTNDGELTHRLTHPSFGVEKEYLVHVEGTPARRALVRLRNGIELDDGMTAPAKVSTVSPNLLQIRRMCDAVGHPVIRLVRTRIGPIVDPALKPGEWRELLQSEVRALAEASAKQRPRRAAR